MPRSRTRAQSPPVAPKPKPQTQRPRRPWAAWWQRLLTFRICLVIVIICTWRYTRDPMFFGSGYDSSWTVPLSLRILYHQDTRLDPYWYLINLQHAHATDHVNGHYYNWYPVAVPLLASPVVWLVDRYERIVYHEPIEHVTLYAVPTASEHRAASIITAIGVAIFFLVGRRELSLPRALLWTFLYAFGTSVWSTASKGLWQHTVSLPLLAAVLYTYGRAAANPRWLYLTGLLAGLSYEVRSTNVLTVLLFAVLIFWRYRRYLAGYAGMVAVGVVPFLLYHQSVYGSWLSPYQIVQRNLFSWLSPTGPQAMVGTLFSPNRGLFVYTPILVFAVIGLWDRWREKRQRLEAAGMALVIAGQWLGISLSVTWWGGYCFGPRLLSDILPYCFMLLIPAVQRLRWPPVRVGAAAYFAAFSVAAVLSVWIHYRGANEWGTYFWDNGPPSVDEAPGRIWSWNDMQILRQRH